MPRRVRDANLETRTARSRLSVAHKPYFRLIEPGLHLGFRKLASGPGTWVVRRYSGSGGYTVKNLLTGDGVLVVADDFSEADGHGVLSFGQAQELAKSFRPAGPAPKPLTVSETLDSYLEFLEHNRKTAEDARYRTDALIRPKLGNIEATHLKADQIRKWLIGVAKAAPRLRTRKDEKQKYRAMGTDKESIRRRRASANRTLTVLKAALNRAWREGKISSNAEWHRVEPFENVDAARIRYLSVTEAQRLINASDPDFRNVIIAALQTGVRYGELAALQVHDFNADAGTVAIRTSKTGEARHVVLTEEGAAFFRQLSAGRSGSGLMLLKANGGAWLKSHQKRPMIEACKRANIKPAVSFHALRHTWASLAVMAGVPLLVVARNLGHADTRMVERHYGHLAPSYIADAIRAGAPRFGPVASSVGPVVPIQAARKAKPR
jgi:integrase